MHTPLKERNTTFTKIEKNITHNLKYIVHIALAILVGVICKKLYPLERKNLGKESFITGIPFLRKAFLLPPTLITIFLLIEIFRIYQKNDHLKSRYNSLLRFFRKVHFGFIFTNLILFIIFQIIYTQVYKPYFHYSQFKFSGHVLASLVSGVAMVNVRFLAQEIYKRGFDKRIMKTIIYICNFIIYHNLYTLVWTIWVYHDMKEALFSFFIALIYIIALNQIDMDGLFGKLIVNKKTIKEKIKII